MTMPYFADDGVTLWLGHVADVLPALPDGSVDCVVTSPPYFGLRDYGVEGQIGLEASPAEYVETMRAVFAQVRRVLADDGVLWLNLGDSYSTRKVVRDSSHQPGFYPDRSDHGTIGKSWAENAADGNARMPGLYGVPEKNLIGTPWRTAFALQDDGWILRNEVIWAKPNGMPESVTDRLTSKHEHLFLLSKSRRYWFDLDPIREAVTSTREAAMTWDRPHAKEREMDGVRVQKRPGRAGSHYRKPVARDGRGFAGATTDPHPQQAPGPDGLGMNERGRNPGDVWTIATSPFPGAHFAVFPPEIPRRCILAGCRPGGTVLDPFHGSGTTGMVAAKLGRRYVGIELNRDYLDLSLRTRLAQTAMFEGEPA